ncbi:uncharacterized protein EV420DRAFT_244281 [Desarmillaria tabescens]|uniref:Extracellular membrane protein CFEM domain-containing protein n=1 Tax=Armillaria tabescens TaxID=1929756 RepID=A0AA39KF13_ARMTA|nr:uncharacterized protein EV420DRAFT_244281 [Desarmillaria tabescens]KAK0459974.1 hypothetical protein EV420DRAFT_244281 [Desarmillaria tabescens]
MISVPPHSFLLLALLSLLTARVLAQANLDVPTGSLLSRITPGSINTTIIPDKCAWQCSILGTISMCGQNQLECFCSVSYQGRVSACIDCYISADQQGGEKLNKLYQTSCDNASSAAAATQTAAELAVASTTKSATSKSNGSSTLMASSSSAFIWIGLAIILYQF